MTLQELQTYIKEMDHKRGFDKESAARCFVGLVEEIGEVAEVVKNLEKPNRNKHKKMDIGAELADTLYYLISLANKFDVDLMEALKQKEVKNSSRDWN
jgi:NTP pyrophosphatase (non-canonical NTP hydrolase)